MHQPTSEPFAAGCPSSGFRSALALVCLWGLAPLAAAQGYRISGRIGDFHVPATAVISSADGARIVFRRTLEDSSEILFAARADGSQQVQLLPAAHALLDFARITPDGTRVVFTADANRTGHPELFVVPIDGSTPGVQLSAHTGWRSEVGGFELSADGQRVVYLHDGVQNDVPQLFSVPLAGGAPTLLSVGGSVASFRVSSTGEVVYATGFSAQPPFDALFSVSIAGGPAVRLDDALGEPFTISGYQLSADGTRVVYAGRSPRRLFSVPTDRHLPPVVLSGAMVAGGQVAFDSGFLVAPNGRVVYRADQERNYVYELYGTTLGGGSTPVKLNPALPANGAVTDMEFDAQGGRVAFRADALADESFELFSAPADGSQPAVQLSSLSAAGDVLWPYAFSPDGSSIAFVADQDVAETFELFVAPAHGSQPAAKRSGPMVAGGDLRTARSLAFRAPFASAEESAEHSFLWSSDGVRLVYLADQDTDQKPELFSVPRDGSQAPVRLSPRLADGQTLFNQGSLAGNFGLAPDGSLLFYVSRDGFGSLMRVPVDRAQPPRVILVPPTAASSTPPDQVASALFTPDGRRALYIDTQLLLDGSALLSVDLQGGPGNIRLLNAEIASLPFAGDCGVQTDLQLTPDGRTVLYRACHDTAGQFELYAAPVDGSQSPLRINAPAIAPVLDYALDPAGQRAVYRFILGLQASELYSAPLDGSGAAVKLDGAGGRVLAYRAGASRVVFLEDAAVHDVFELYSAPLDGSQPAVRLSTTPVAGGDVVGFELAPDPQWVVYRADQDADERFELFAVPTDGSQPPIRLNGALPQGSSGVFDFRVNALGTRVVYRADQGAADVIDLYGVPIDGSAPAVRLNLSRPLGDVQSDYQLSSDGLGVAYRSDQDIDGRFQLYVAPISGSFGPQKKSGALEDVLDVQLSPDHVWLVFRGRAVFSSPVELYRAPIFGSAAPARIDTTSIPGAVVSDFQISPDSQTVVFRGNLRMLSKLELFSAPLDGSSAPRRESGELVSGGRVLSYGFDAASAQVLYRADQDFVGHIELYLGALQRPKARRAP